jgi:anti-anti-sigma regulatory factor
MALFSKPTIKKPGMPKPEARPASDGATTRSVPRSIGRPVSAREMAVEAQGRRLGAESPRAEPHADISVLGESLIEWSPPGSSIEVAQANPGLCAVLENAALLYASGQLDTACSVLDQGVEADHETNRSPLAWLALFDLLQRANNRAAFEQLALRYVVQFERSAPAWEEGLKTTAGPKAVAGGYIPMTGKLSVASAAQLDVMKSAIQKKVPHARLDLGSVSSFDDTGARLLADALAHARKHRFALTLQRPEKLKLAVDAIVKKGRDGGEGAWLLSLELLQFDFKQEAFDDRAIEYAVTFEQSPPSWEPPPAPATPAGHVDVVAIDQSSDADAGDAVPDDVAKLVWSGVMVGQSTPQLAKLPEFSGRRAVVVIDMTEVERIDFVCAGSMLNAINRIEQQRKTVQIVGATPIIRALLLLIGISPRHFLKKAQ